MPNPPDNLVDFFNKNSDVSPQNRTIIKIEVNGCKIEMGVYGTSDNQKTQELLETCIKSVTNTNKPS